ncbi:MAG: TonB-dependent receptor plug domain-containing protein [Alphaproteobacteria bacterium]
MLRNTITALMATTMLFPVAVYANDTDPDDLLDLSLEELSNISVTSVSKTEEKADQAAAAIYVITQEDIRRSGATAIPELLRMVPGVTVTRAGSHDWTVTARGFNGQFSNKLLVLIDGRTIYSPLFSGVVWDVQDTVMEDIDRIEVIRGPGATLWGANAVNGVINIITKSAKDTEGTYASFAAGNQVRAIGAVRHGVRVDEDTNVRVYAKHSDYDSEFALNGSTANDDWKRSQAGFRMDSKLSNGDTLNVQGDAYTIDEDLPYTIPNIGGAPSYTSTVEGAIASGANLLTRWETETHPDSHVSLQAYVDHTFYKTTYFNDETNTLDIDFQQVWTGWERQEVVWGAGYRFINSENDPSSQQYSLVPATRNDSLFNAFVQDKITILPDEVYVTIGSKFEHNDYSGNEIQPSVRVSWFPAENQTVWASVSHAVHTPNRFTDDGNLILTIIPPGGLPTILYSAGNHGLESEELTSYEIGYRIQPTETTSLDVAAFYFDYDDIFAATTGTAVVSGGAINVPVYATNTNEARSVGVEVAGKWNISKDWQTAGSYSYIDEVFSNKFDIATPFAGRTPKHQFNVRSTYLFSDSVEMTNALYFVDHLNGGAVVNEYYRFDTRISYNVMEGVELSLIGQNLLDDRHQEFVPFGFKNTAEIGRSVYGKVTLRF